ncbi:MAG: hypothetical protein ABFE01_19070 [Phycisphaerales bacterium]|jgi:hypothetical protein
MSKSEWISHGQTVFYTLFLAFCGVLIVDTRFDTYVTESELKAFERGVPVSLAPSNLDTSPESLRLGLNVELDGSPGEEMAKTKAWQKLQATVSEYARRLEFVEGQYRLIRLRESKHSLRITFLYGGSFVGWLLLSALDRKNKRSGRSQDGLAVRTQADPSR